MTNTNLQFEILKRLGKDIVESVGKIESVSLQNNQVYALIRYTSGEDGDNNLRLFNDIYASNEEDLSFFELSIPISNIDLSKDNYSPTQLIGKYASVTVFEGRAISAEIIGDFKSKEERPTNIDQDFFFTARMRLIERGEATTADNVQNELIALGLDRTTAFSLFQVKLADVLNKVVIWAGESYFHKDTAKPDILETVQEPPEFLRSLNRTPMKVKACHKFNKLFTGR